MQAPTKADIRRDHFQAEPTHHFSGGEPTEGLHRLLRDVGEDGVGAAEGHQCGAGEEQALFGEDAVAAGEQHDGDHLPASRRHPAVARCRCSRSRTSLSRAMIHASTTRVSTPSGDCCSLHTSVPARSSKSTSTPGRSCGPPEPAAGARGSRRSGAESGLRHRHR